jgi:hypothetical protein
MSLPFMQPYMGLGNSLQTAQGGAAGGVGGWVELGRTTLGSDNATIDVTSLADKRYLMVLTEGKTSSTNADFALRFNADTGSNYASRQKWDGGGSDYVLTSQTHYRPLGTSLDQPFCSIDYGIGSEKLSYRLGSTDTHTS